MAFEYNDDKKETGTDVALELPGASSDVPVTSVSFSKEAETSEVQFNNSYTQNIAITGVTYSGSFEIAGRNEAVRGAIRQDGSLTENEGNLGTTLPAYIGSMTIIDGDDTEYIFRNVLITSYSKDMPADDRTTQSYDFSAEKLDINAG